MRLDIRELATEEFLGSVACQILDVVVVFTATVVPGAGIAFRILVRHPRTHGMHHLWAHMVLRGDQLERSSAADRLHPRGSRRRLDHGIPAIQKPPRKVHPLKSG